jgi:sugar O-acyltransferase (sialic acid O-acetyltransferase NeuD family)
MHKVIVFGNQEVAAINYFYLTHDSPFEVVAFTVDQAYIKEDMLCGLPVVPFEQVEAIFPPAAYKMSVFLGFRDVNQFRARKYSQAKANGYELVSYVSSKAIVWPDLVIGENSLIAEGAIVQPHARIGNNVIVSPGAVVGHHSVIQDHCFIASRAVLLGKVTVEPFCVLGANCTIKDSVRIRRQCIIGAGSYISEDTREKGIYINKPAKLMPKSSDELGRLLAWAEDVRRTKGRSP